VEAHEKVAAFLEADLANTEAEYTNPPASTVLAAARRNRGWTSASVGRTG
jgi:hypothetical protein